MIFPFLKCTFMHRTIFWKNPIYWKMAMRNKWNEEIIRQWTKSNNLHVHQNKIDVWPLRQKSSVWRSTYHVVKLLTTRKPQANFLDSVSPENQFIFLLNGLVNMALHHRVTPFSNSFSLFNFPKDCVELDSSSHRSTISKIKTTNRRNFGVKLSIIGHS